MPCYLWIEEELLNNHPLCCWILGSLGYSLSGTDWKVIPWSPNYSTLYVIVIYIYNIYWDILSYSSSLVLLTFSIRLIQLNSLCFDQDIFLHKERSVLSPFFLFSLSFNTQLNYIYIYLLFCFRCGGRVSLGIFIYISPENL